MNLTQNFISSFYKEFPELKSEFIDYLKQSIFFDPEKDTESYQLLGFPNYLVNLMDNKKYSILKKLLDFIENKIGINKEIDELIEIRIFEDIVTKLSGRDSDNNTHQFKEFEKLLGQKSINLCRKNEALWNSLDREPKSLGNMIRFLKEHNQ